VHCCGRTDVELGGHYDIREEASVEAIRREARLLGLAVPLGAGPGGGAAIGSCDVPSFPAGSKQWSLSPLCTNRAFVEDQAQRLAGMNGSFQKIVGLVVLPVGGAIADALGRKPVLAVYALVLSLACVFYAMDAASQGSLGTLGLLLAGALLCVSWDPKENCLNAAVVDVFDNQADRGRAFACLGGLNSAGQVLGSVATYFCMRQRLENYTVPWLMFAAVGFGVFLLIVLALPETFPAELRKPVTGSMLNPLKSQWQALSLLAQDRVLAGLAGLHFLVMFHFVGFIVLSFSYLLLNGFSMDQALLPGMLGSVAQVLWTGAAVVMLPRLGLWSCYIAGHALFAVAYMFWGPYTVLVGPAGPYLGQVVQSAAWALLGPAMNAIVSERTQSDNQGKCFSAISTMGTLGIMLGVPFYSGALFDGTATGLQLALPCLVSAGVAVLSAALASVLRAFALREGSYAPAGDCQA